MILSEKTGPRKNYHKIISLVPSQTELLAYLGLREEVAGITKFCIHPDKWYRTKTRVGGTKNIHFEIIDQISPDLIIANKEENVKEQVEALAEKYDVWITDVNNFSDAITMIEDVGKLTGKQDKAHELTVELNHGFQGLRNKYSIKRKIPTAYFIWKDPYMVAGGCTFINDMMNYCGLDNVFADQPRYPEITLDELSRRETELILLSSEPYPFKEKHIDEMQGGFPGIKIILTDGEMFSWYGSRLLKSADYFDSFGDVY